MTELPMTLSASSLTDHNQMTICRWRNEWEGVLDAIQPAAHTNGVAGSIAAAPTISLIFNDFST